MIEEDQLNIDITADTTSFSRAIQAVALQLRRVQLKNAILHAVCLAFPSGWRRCPHYQGLVLRAMSWPGPNWPSKW